jgi:hypothetical protein
MPCLTFQTLAESFVIRRLDCSYSVGHQMEWPVPYITKAVAPHLYSCLSVFVISGELDPSRDIQVPKWRLGGKIQKFWLIFCRILEYFDTV